MEVETGGKEMKKDNLLFSLDGIAKPWLLNKHGYYICVKTLNNCLQTRIKNENLDLNEIGIIPIISAEVTSTEQSFLRKWKFGTVPRSDNSYEWLLTTPEKYEDGSEDGSEENLLLKTKECKSHLLNKNIFNTKKDFYESEYSMFFEKPVFIWFLDQQVRLRIVLEHKHFFKKQRLKKYKLYKIKLNFTEEFWKEAREKNIFDDIQQESLEFCYYGITKRDVFQRFIEHKKKAEENSGYIFHKTWHKWSKKMDLLGGKFNVHLLIVKDSDSLDEIYDYEEAFVGYDSLHPLGLNAIPGGHAGIQELHKFKLLKSIKNVSLREREKAVEQFIQKGYKIKNKNLPMPHDRKEHKRVLRSGRVVDVRACKVKGGKSYVRLGQIH